MSVLYNVYALSIDGVTFRYVGATKYPDVKKRATQLKAQRFQASTPVHLWAQEVVSQGHTIIATLLEADCSDDNRDREAWWIVELRSQGHNLLNVLGGGKKGFSRPTSWNRGKKTGPRSEETRKKLSEAQRGRVAWNKGKPHSEETKQKLRKVVVSKETREKQRNARLGKKASPETRKKLSESRKGKKLSDETRAKLSESIKAWHATRRVEHNNHS